LEKTDQYDGFCKKCGGDCSDIINPVIERILREIGIPGPLTDIYFEKLDPSINGKCAPPGWTLLGIIGTIEPETWRTDGLDLRLFCPI
jgi:hypothetical protein